ncbi:MAG: DUF2336 domain-containing protein [Rhodospirillaceae bacterium]|nr:DUF2336 domain-containing protein [Rhodospirillaceae bacterium]
MNNTDTQGNTGGDSALHDPKEIAAHGDPQARQRLASDASAPPEILYYLASDESLPVRKAVASNPATPLQADFILSNDAEASIRMDLAMKIGNRLGFESDELDDNLLSKVNKVLGNLINDQMLAVRAIVAEEIKGLENVPKGVISKLARDAEAAVSAPVLEHSPLLDDDELVEIITQGVRDEVATAIARRENIGQTVTASISHTGSIVAIEALLENKTATISPTALDEITDLAQDHQSLHQSLAKRDDLPEPTLQRMAGFVGSAIVEELLERYPLTDVAKDGLRSAVQERIEAGDAAPSNGNASQISQYRILVVEDDSTMRMLIRQIIESFLSAEVLVTSDGDRALSIIEDGGHFDLIVCDWMMPVMSGIEFLRALRERGDETPFAMLTSRKDVDSVVSAQKYGVDAFITKPVTAAEIQGKLRMLLRGDR